MLIVDKTPYGQNHKTMTICIDRYGDQQCSAEGDRGAGVRGETCDGNDGMSRISMNA